jgi:hypothetical protein
MGMFSKRKDGVAEYQTGVKRSALNVRYDLLTPVGLRRVAEAAHEGAVKYGEFNCEKGLPISVYLNHALNHIFLYLGGDRSEDHLGHAAWGLLFACHSEELNPELNTDLRAEGCRMPKTGAGKPQVLVEEDDEEPQPRKNPLLGGR